MHKIVYNNEALLLISESERAYRNHRMVRWNKCFIEVVLASQKISKQKLVRHVGGDTFKVLPLLSSLQNGKKPNQGWEGNKFSFYNVTAHPDYYMLHVSSIKQYYICPAAERDTR